MQPNHRTQNLASLAGSALLMALLITLGYYVPDGLIALAHK
ncbi:hypothetical protein LCGC14_0089130 [marine sediment metagenome]|uniref:Uncharacterized protein n=1 Tax=marine sediment metagenome TaxID=412755 RepID=A0A0F9YHU8_9ZZZZ